MTAFYRTITVVLDLAADAPVTIDVEPLGSYYSGTLAVTSVSSLAVSPSGGALREATITDGVTTLNESWLKDGTAGGSVTGNASISLTTGQWIVTFYCVLNVTAHPEQVVVDTLTGIGTVIGTPPYGEATIKVDGVTAYIEDFLVAWVADD